MNPDLRARDARLIERCRAGDQTAFGELVDRHLRPMWGAAYALTGSTADADDAVQEAFLAAWRDLPRLRDPGRFSSWLLQILRKKIAGGRRRAQRCQRLIGRARDAAIASPSHEPSEEEAMQKREIEEILNGEVARLPEALRLPLVLYYLEDESTESVASRLGLSEPAVRKRLQRARHRLRGDLETRLGAAMIALDPPRELRARILDSVSSVTPVTALKSVASWSAAGVGAVSVAALVLVIGVATSWWMYRSEPEPQPKEESPAVVASSIPSAVMNVEGEERGSAGRVGSRLEALPRIERSPAVPEGEGPSTSEAPDISGKVTWKDGGEPAAGLLVRLEGRPETGFVRVVTSDEAGEFAFEDIPSGHYRLQAESREQQTVFSVPAQLELTQGAPVHESLIVEPGYFVSGRVLDGLTDEPLEGYGLWISRVEEPRRAWIVAPTDSEGRFATTYPICAGEMQLRLNEPHRTTVDALSSLLELVVPDTVEVASDIEDLVLRHPWRGRLAARVVDESGVPIEGATVSALKSDWRRRFYSESIGELHGRRSQTDADGRATLPCLPSDTAIVLFAQAPGHFHGESEILLSVLEESPEPVEIQLGASGRLSGRVLGPDGVAAAGAKVTANPGLGEMAPGPDAVLADVDGRFAFDQDIWPGEHPFGMSLRAKWQGLDSGFVVVQKASFEDVVLELEATRTIVGNVVRTDGTPYLGKGEIRGRLVSDRHFVSGTFREGQFSLEQMHPGEYELTLWEKLAEGPTIRVSADEGEFVWDGPVAGLVVELVDAETGAKIPEAHVWASRGEGVWYASTTDADGRCRYPVGAGTVRVMAIAEGRAYDARTLSVTEGQVGDVELRLALPETQAFSARIIDPAGEPVPHSRVCVAAPFPNPLGEERLFGFTSTEVLTDEDGQFVIFGLPSTGGWIRITRDTDWAIRHYPVTSGTVEIVFE
ncbi:MAG: sigma-70 family RNA polymerase sigma factor [Planctomycetota bacterium]